MSIRVVVFDFDGTLVDSNTLKYDTYFDLFPRDEYHDRVIRGVLSTCFEESRYAILEKILRELGECSDTLQEHVKRLADQYNDIVMEGAKTCPECPDAEILLQQLRPRYALYLSSTTPEEALREIISFRRWTAYFKDIFGYPRKKHETLQEIIAKERVSPSQVLVVGDGESDRASAEQVDCAFFDVRDRPLSSFPISLL